MRWTVAGGGSTDTLVGQAGDKTSWPKHLYAMVNALYVGLRARIILSGLTIRPVTRQALPILVTCGPAIRA